MTIEDLEEQLTPNRKRFLLVSNILISITIAVDLLFITNIITLPLAPFTLFNLVMLGIALLGYRIKKNINEELAKRRAAKDSS